MHRRKVFVGALSGLSVTAVLGVTLPAFAARNDILVSLAGGNLVALTINGATGIETTKDGSVSLETDAPFCVPQPGAPCSYSVNYIKVRLNDFVVETNQGDYTMSNTYALVRGPFALTDLANGIDVPLGTTVEIGANVDGPHVSGFQTAEDTLTQPLTLLMSPVNGVLTLDGTLPFDFFVSDIDQQFTGSISGMMTGVAPYTNTAPFANAGPNIEVTCPQLVPLGIFNSTDLENNINQITWNFSGSAATGTLFGPDPSVFVGPGVAVASLSITDAFGGVGSAQTTITVHLPPPSFDSTPAAQVVAGCSVDASAVPVRVPNAKVCGTAVPVTASVTTYNGAAVTIPVQNGSVNLPPGTGTIQFSASNANGVSSTLTQTITVLPPPAIYGATAVTIDSGSTVAGTLFAGAGGQLVLQNDAASGSVISVSPVVLQDRVTAPSIDTAAGVTPGHSDNIGAFLTTPPTLPPFPALSPVFSGTSAVLVHPTPQSPFVVTLPPGEYGPVTVYSRGQLVLSSGAYEFTSLDLEPQAQLVTPSSSGETAHVFVRDNLIYRGSTVTSSGQSAPLFLGYAGTVPLTVESAFSGTIIAPRAQLNLQSLNGAGVYAGEFFASQVVLSPHTTVNSHPFTCTATCVSGCQ